MELVRQGGYVMYLLIGIALAVVAMTVRSWLSVTRGERRPDAAGQCPPPPAAPSPGDVAAAPASTR